jgi:hypothetical protein
MQRLIIEFLFCRTANLKQIGCLLLQPLPGVAEKNAFTRC